MQTQSKIFSALFTSAILAGMFFSLSAMAAVNCGSTCVTDPADHICKWTCCDDETPEYCQKNAIRSNAEAAVNDHISHLTDTPPKTTTGTQTVTDCQKKCDTCAQHNLQTTWPTSPLNNKLQLTNCSTLGDLVKYLYSWGVSLGGIAVFISLVIAGFEYITSIGNPGKMKDSVGRIESAAIGLALLLGSYAIFDLINPNITKIASNFDIIQYGSAYNKCTSRNDCCQKSDPKTGQPLVDASKKPIYDPACSLTDWNCCAINDSDCMRTGDQTTSNHPNPSGVANSQCCCGDDECQSGYCNLSTNQCDTMVPVCLRAVTAPQTGCDAVVFYNSPQFNSTSDTDKVTVEAGAFNQSSFKFFATDYSSQANFSPKSYAAYRYKTITKDGNTVSVDAKGNPIETCTTTTVDNGGAGSDVISCTPINGADGKPLVPALIPCGPSACGCTVALCFQVQAGQCAQDNRDPQTQAVTAPAFNFDYTKTDNILGFMVQDESKKGALSQDWDSIWNIINQLKTYKNH